MAKDYATHKPSKKTMAAIDKALKKLNNGERLITIKDSKGTR